MTAVKRGERSNRKRKVAVDDIGAARTRDPERTRARILEAATDEFSQRGLGGARVDAIARRAGANKRMLYHYFGNKEGLFLAVMEHTYAHIRTQEEALHLDDLAPVQAMRRLMRFTFRYFLGNPHFIVLLNSENLHRARHIRRSPRVKAINSPLIEALGRVLRRGRAAGLFRSGVDPLQLYMSIAGVCYFYFSNIHTLSTIFDRDLMSSSALAARERHVIDVIMGYLRA
ncbi:TetR/AcrR family transcriptional regulator [Vineibacter terrae]|uniref:TetR/AcrR family transcriptional regulator n=1 Tax=Vineibacter terrae TaxID=2586908 RepID=A0A5C8PRX6_9HYPH|nr:TetR/AcrR family transcriptional regulator [Vineibacter terrae]TXL79490.1 TetR/AcrR family transcriptional regulator [Vineibacter terrae]